MQPSLSLCLSFFLSLSLSFSLSPFLAPFFLKTATENATVATGKNNQHRKRKRNGIGIMRGIGGQNATLSLFVSLSLFLSPSLSVFLLKTATENTTAATGKNQPQK
jgi:multidrug efflux pump subunit AcrB